MDDASALEGFLEKTFQTDLRKHAARFMKKLTREVHGSNARVDVSRSVRVDETSLELIVTDVIETRVGCETEPSSVKFDA